MHEPISAPQQGASAEGIGAMLRRRRIELGLSQSDVAQVVKLPPRRIESLEQERWHELPDGPYLRGFLKNVARALNIDAQTLMARLDDSLMQSRNPESILVAPGSTHATLPRRSGPADDRRSGRRLVFGAFVFALIAALIAWSGTESFDRAVHLGRTLIAAYGDGTQRESTGTMQSSIDVPAATSASQATQAAVATAMSDAKPSTTEASPKPTTAAAAVPVLRFQFTQDSWVEVRSSDGHVLLSQTSPAGTEQTVDGDAPFSLVVGNAKGVELRYRGQPVDLTPYTKGAVARLTLS